MALTQCTYIVEWIKNHKIWSCLVVLRFIGVFWPQQGYIHPDEFFQSVEITAGDMLNISVLRTWEFKEGLRSISPIYLVSGIPFYLTMMIPEFRSSYWLLVLPRLIMCCLSLLIDYCGFSIGQYLKLNTHLILTLLASSYISLTYYTRTLSNSLESVFVSICLIFIIKLIQILDKTVRTSVTEKEKLRYHRLSLEEFRQKKTLNSNPSISRQLEASTFNQGKEKTEIHRLCFLIGLFSAAGFFVRPTFVAFMVTPFLCLFYVMIVNNTDLIVNQLFCIIGAFISFIFIVLTDTMYFNKKSVFDIMSHFKLCVIIPKDVNECWQGFFRTFVVTPWNFIQYNTNKDNLSSHGLHPYYTHSLVNIPLLFGPLCFCVIISLLTMVNVRKLHKRDMLFLIFIIPVAILSFFPHQEPRFLIPLLPIIVLISVFLLQNLKFIKPFIFIWIIFNMSLTLFYGIFHQGGVISLISHIQKVSNDKPKFSNQDTYIFSHTYMPPRHLFLSNATMQQVVDLQGSNMANLSENINLAKTSTHGNTFVVLPGSLMSDFRHLNYTFQIIKVFPSHLSMENPPNFSALFQNNEFTSNIKKLLEVMSLFLLKINFV